MKYVEFDNYIDLMDVPTNIRHVSVIGNVNHGKTALLNSIFPFSGVISDDAGSFVLIIERGPDPDPRISPSRTTLTMHFELDEDLLCDVRQETNGNKFILNLVHAPGHIEYSSEITAALRVTDGALLIVDCVEGVCEQTETLLRQALMERVRPVLFVNKVDRAIIDLQLDPEAVYALLLRTIEAVNASISTYHDEALGNCQVSPELGNVAFGSGNRQWAFTLRQFAVRYSKTFGIDREKMMELLWGDNFYNESTKEWTTSAVADDGTPNQRGFCKFVLDPIYKLLKAVRNNDVDTLKAIIENMGIKLSEEELEDCGMYTFNLIMRKFLPVTDSLLEMFTIHLPSPVTAQKYRVETLYEGPIEDECAMAIRNCDPKGPLMLYVPRMMPSCDRNGYCAYGRVLSGTVQAGQTLRIQGPKYEPRKKEDVFVTTIDKCIWAMVWRRSQLVKTCSAGNIVSFGGADQFLFKPGTITSSETAHNLRVMHFAALPVLRVAVDVKNSDDLPKLVKGLKSLSESDLCVQCYTAKTGEHIVACGGELHLEICLKNLEEVHARVPLVRSDPAVLYCETIRKTSSETALSRSANGHNCIFMTAQPMEEEVAADIEQDRVNPRGDFQACARYLSETHGWDDGDARKILSFGPDSAVPNVLINATNAVESSDEIKNSVVSGFQLATAEGALCGEPLRACRFNVTDMALHADATSGDSDKITSATRNAVHAAQLLADPALLEPVFLVEIQCTDRVLGVVHDVLSRRSGRIISEAQRAGTPVYTIKAHMPVSESFGFSTELRTHTAGHAFQQSVFDHWRLVPGSPLDPTSKAGEIVAAIRTRKGLSPAVPSLEDILNRA